jgi:glycopeptide antibiotics resistance protein
MYLINGEFFNIIGVICYLAIRGFIFIKNKKKPQILLNEMTKLLFVIYCLMVVSVTLFPFPIGFPVEYENLSVYLNLTPLVSILKQVSLIGTAYDGDILFMIGLIIRNVGGNILLFVPLGFLVPLIWKSVIHFKHIFLFAIGISVTIELLQLLESIFGGWGRVTDIDDVICNVAGAILGYYINKWFMLLTGRYQSSFVHRLFRV